VPTLVAMLTKIKEDDLGRMIMPSKGESSQLSGPILALRKIGKPAVAAIIPLLKHEEPIVRYSAAAVLSGMNKGEAAEALPKIQEALEAERGLGNGQMIIFEELVAATINHGGDADKVVPAIIELLKSDDEAVRYRAAKMLARVGRKAEPAVSKLIELLNDPKPQVQAAAIEALTAIGPAAKDAVIALAKKVEGDDVQLARDAATALRGFGPIAAPAAPALAKALDSNDSSLCLDAANALAAIGPEAVSAIDAIAKHLLDETGRRDERIALLQATAAIGPPAKQAIPAVNTLLTRKEIPVQVAAAETLGKIGAGDPEAIKKLGEVLKVTSNPQAIQHAVLRALAGMGAKGNSAALDVKVYQDQTRDAASKVWASATLVALGSDADTNAKAVLAALRDAAPTAKTARVAAIESAEYLGARAKPGVPDLIEALKDKSAIGRTDGGTVREKAAQALGRLGATAKEAIRPLTDMLKETDRAARRAAAEALGLFGPDAVVAAPKLRELARTDPELAGVANAALDRLEPMKKME
jgi:HEAT repeat protein